MSSVKEGFELLDSLGVNREVQRYFMQVLREDKSGRLMADYRDENGNTVDWEILTVSKHKFSSRGFLCFSTALPETVRALYISDALMPLVFLVGSKYKRLDFTYAAFMATGARMEKELVQKGIEQYPSGIKIYTVFGHSILGRIRDCKVQHWAKGLDCTFRVEREKIVATFKGSEFTMGRTEFSLRNHLRQVGVRQTVATIKPFDKNIDNFNLFNYF